jgi:hypothetical protein
MGHATDELQCSVNRFLSEGPAPSVRGFFGEEAAALRAKARGLNGIVFVRSWSGKCGKQRGRKGSRTGLKKIILGTDGAGPSGFLAPTGYQINSWISP